MPIRITGMNSGLDTESIITELIKAKSQKKTTLEKAQKKLSYKQDAWKTLNSKIYSLYSKTINNMAYTTAYKKQTTSVSNESVASVITGTDASNGMQNLTVTSLATSGYLTGAQLSETGAYSKSTKLCEITGSGIGTSDEITFSVKTKGTTTDIKLNGSSTINDVVTQLKNAGLNANFDEKNQRMFVSASETGEKADFALTASSDAGFKALSALGINVLDAASKKQYDTYATLNNSENAALKQQLIDEEVAKQVESVQKQLESINTAITEHEKKIGDFLTEYGYKDADGNVDTSNLDTDYDALVAQKTSLSTAPADETEEAKKTREEKLSEVEKKIKAYDSYRTEVSGLASAKNDKAAAEAKLENDNAAIKASVAADMENKINYATQVVNGTATGFSKDATRIKGEDAVITLNDAVFTSKSNTFEINGLTITAKAETKTGEVVTLTTSNDYEAIYGTIKKFIKEYNELINEMDKLYNADSAKGYEPLTDEEKEVMSESEIEKWEEKIKNSVLRRDSTLSTISNIFTSTMSAGYEVDGETMYLSHFGINTLGYFTSADNEKHAYHIDGDPDDSNTSGNADILKTMIANDPEKVISFFTKLSKSLYSSIGEKMKSDDYSSYNKVYNDKQMEKEYKSYTEKIAEQEEKITAAEDKYYKQFSAMETALAKMQSKTNAISGLLGG
ncbi:MAG: flagellar filament capping protein FliD [Lachnospiraceae bacterium]|nr:flagellar filament capping protein FliD [Lachnospiraceae bacterium]